jgi:hypothetical protein
VTTAVVTHKHNTVSGASTADDLMVDTTGFDLSEEEGVHKELMAVAKALCTVQARVADRDSDSGSLSDDTTTASVDSALRAVRQSSGLA